MNLHWFMVCSINWFHHRIFLLICYANSMWQIPHRYAHAVCIELIHLFIHVGQVSHTSFALGREGVCWTLTWCVHFQQTNSTVKFHNRNRQCNQHTENIQTCRSISTKFNIYKFVSKSCEHIPSIHRITVLIFISISLQTFRHGFPHSPTALAYDPVQKLLAIGDKSGSLRMYPFSIVIYYQHPKWTLNWNADIFRTQNMHWIGG